MLMQLCIAIAEGRKWLGFDCRKGRVLYVNLEIDPASCVHRFLEIYRAMGLQPKHRDDILIWNLRGHAVPLDKLVPRLVRRVKHKGLDAIVIDPIYKVITGDENSASEMAAFCNQFDRICEGTGCSVIYCHHHSKGVQGQKRAMDRASGSGVFARDPDAQLDMIELALNEELKEKTKDSPVPVTAWRMESSLREFRNFQPVNFWFRYPLHYVEQNEELAKMPTQGSPEAGRMKNKKSKTSEKAAEDFRKAYWALYEQDKKEPTVAEMAEYLHVKEKTVYYRAKIMGNEFRAKAGVVHCLNNEGAEQPEQPQQTLDWDDEITDD